MPDTPASTPKSGGIKLKLNTSTLSQQAAASPSPAVPPSATSSAPRLKLTSKARFTEDTPQSSPVVASPRLKLTLKKSGAPGKDASESSKKRPHDGANGTATQPVKKPKLKLNMGKAASTTQQSELSSAFPSAPFLKIKVSGQDKEKYKKRTKQRPKGYAYDSEASDRELDPVQHWNFILRMPPGEDADWVRSIIESRQLEANKRQLTLRFLQEDGRRAIFSVRSNHYAAILVDLPCIIESMKGWDKKGWWKSTDIHQMLLVLGTITTEEEALNYPVPKAEVNEATWQYAHGLTPPMHWVRKRRFRNRLSTHAIQDVEEQVKRLLERDAQAQSVRYELIDRNVLQQEREEREMLEMQQEDEDEDVDDEGEYEAEEDIEEDLEEEIQQEANEDLVAEFEDFMGANDGDLLMAADPAETPDSSGGMALGPQDVTDSEAQTPAANGGASKASSDDEDEDEDDDESEKEELAGMQRAREEIVELEAAIKERLVEVEKVSNPLLKARIKSKISALQADLDMKKAAAGDEDDD